MGRFNKVKLKQGVDNKPGWTWLFELNLNRLGKFIWVNFG
jgi:hypothetical protein